VTEKENQSKETNFNLTINKLNLSTIVYHDEQK